MWAVARRPKWIALLLFVLLLAALFAFLGRWQLERSIENGKPGPASTETQKSLDDLTGPGLGVKESYAGQRVRVTGTFAAADVTVLTGRSGGGKFQTVGRLVDSATGGSLPVVVGYANSRAAAERGGERIAHAGSITVEGRYYPDESPDQDNYEKGEHSAVSAASLVNTWSDFHGKVYQGYVVSSGTIAVAAGLGTVADRAPTRNVQLDWLNLFYAIEWVVFAGFAIFLWYRFVKDAWEREEEERLELHAASHAAESAGAAGDHG